MPNKPDVQHITRYLGATTGITQDGHLLSGIEPGMSSVLAYEGRGYGPTPGTTWYPRAWRKKPEMPYRRKRRDYTVVAIAWTLSHAATGYGTSAFPINRYGSAMQCFRRGTPWGTCAKWFCTSWTSQLYQNPLDLRLQEMTDLGYVGKNAMVENDFTYIDDTPTTTSGKVGYILPHPEEVCDSINSAIFLMVCSNNTSEVSQVTATVNHNNNILSMNMVGQDFFEGQEFTLQVDCSSIASALIEATEFQVIPSEYDGEMPPDDDSRWQSVPLQTSEYFAWQDPEHPHTGHVWVRVVLPEDEILRILQ